MLSCALIANTEMKIQRDFRNWHLNNTTQSREMRDRNNPKFCRRQTGKQIIGQEDAGLRRAEKGRRSFIHGEK